MSDDQIHVEAEAKLAADLLEFKIPARSGDTAPTLDELPRGADLVLVEAALRRLGRDLAAADPLRRALERERSMAILKKIGMASPGRLVDAALGVECRPEDVGAGTALVLDDPDPWEESVEGDLLLDELVSLFNRFVTLPAGGAEVLAGFVVTTYVYQCFDHATYVALVSALKRCGKTAALRMLKALVHRSLSADSISPSALFRTIEEAGPTLLLDEVDRLSPDSDLWGVINGGYTKDSFVIRTVGETFEPRKFSTFGPKVLCYIRGSRSTVPDTTEDRCIRITMQRRARAESGEKLRSKKLEAMAGPLRRKLVRWAQDSREKLQASDPVIPDQLDDRAADVWEPILAVADLAGQEWSRRLRELAITFSGDRGEDEKDDPRVLVLADISEMLDMVEQENGGVSAEDLCSRLEALADRPWRTWGRKGSGLEPVHLARLLRPYGLRSVLVGTGYRRVRRYQVEALRATCSRYAPSGPESFGKPATPAPSPDPLRINRDESRAGAGERVERVRPAPERVCADPPAQSSPAEDVYHHRGQNYRPGDTLPDGRLLESIETGIPILVRPRAAKVREVDL